MSIKGLEEYLTTPPDEARDEATEGALRVWWMPQVGADIPPFYVPVPNMETAAIVADVLANYDLFQFENKIKPDYANMGGVERFEDGEWCDVEEEEIEESRAA